MIPIKSYFDGVKAINRIVLQNNFTKIMHIGIAFFILSIFVLAPVARSIIMRLLTRRNNIDTIDLLTLF